MVVQDISVTKTLEENLDYDDTLLQFYTACHQYGVRNVLIDFRRAFPDMFDEVNVQINRLKPERQVPSLLKDARSM
jgi:hypothetical protein